MVDKGERRPVGTIKIRSLPYIRAGAARSWAGLGRPGRRCGVVFACMRGRGGVECEQGWSAGGWVVGHISCPACHAAPNDTVPNGDTALGTADTPMYDMLKLFEIGRSHMAVLTQPTPAALERRSRAVALARQRQVRAA